MRPHRTLTAEQVARALGVSGKTLRKLIRARLFPDSFLVSDGTRRWIAQDVEAYLHLRSRIGGKRLPLGEDAEDSSEKSTEKLPGPAPTQGGETARKRRETPEGGG